MSEKAPKRGLKSVIAIAFPAICICAVLIGIGVFHSGAALHICPARAAHYNITVEVEGTTIQWEGEVGGIQTGITIKLPSQESVYEGWKRPVGHCHGHVWWVSYCRHVRRCLSYIQEEHALGVTIINVA